MIKRGMVALALAAGAALGGVAIAPAASAAPSDCNPGALCAYWYTDYQANQAHGVQQVYQNNDDLTMYNNFYYSAGCYGTVSVRDRADNAVASRRVVRPGFERIYRATARSVGQVCGPTKPSRTGQRLRRYWRSFKPLHPLPELAEATRLSADSWRRLGTTKSSLAGTGRASAPLPGELSNRS